MTAQLTLDAMLPAALRIRGLSRRQAEVATLIAQGLANRDIAERLYIEEQTVKNHVTAILRTLGMDNRLQVARWIWRLGEETA